MNDLIQLGVIPLIKCALKTENGVLPEDFYSEQYIKIAKEHQITNIIYEGALLCGADIQNPVMKTMFSRSCKNLIVCENQAYEIGAVCDALESNAIKHMLLKGVILKDLYPKADMREMCDADILIDINDHDKISGIMLSLGFEETQESVHEFIFKKGKITVEMHKCLVPERHDRLAKHFEDPWALAQSVENAEYRYHLLPVEHYIYVFAHLAKHYIDGGVGIKHITDMFVLRNNQTYDEKYVTTVLAEMGLEDFYGNILNLIDVWFYGAKSNEVVDLITKVIVSAGAYGTFENRIVSQAVSGNKNTKFKAFLKLVFPPASEMKFAYPILKKRKYLLPFVWAYRWGAVLLGKRGNIAAAKAKVDCVDAEKVREYRDALKFVGLEIKDNKRG